MIIALSMIRTFWISIDDVRIFITYMISNDINVCNVDNFKKSKNYHMYNIVLKLIMTLWLRMMFETMRKKKYITNKMNDFKHCNISKMFQKFHDQTSNTKIRFWYFNRAIAEWYKFDREKIKFFFWNRAIVSIVFV